MKSKFMLIFLMAIFSIVFSQGQSFNQNAILFADSLMKARYPASDPGAVLLIAKDGQPVFKKGYGMASMELKVSDQPANLFAIGSMTKQFTAVAILQLEQRGLLSLSDDIKKYLPDFNTYGQKITIENLLTHTGGLVSMIDIKSFKDIDGKKENVVYDPDAPLLFKPGSAWSYSNTGYFLLGLIIQKVSGTSYEDFVRKNIFEPTNMTHTYFGTHEKILPELAGGYDPIGSADFKPTASYSWAEPYSVGGIISNVNDLLKWDEALYGETIIKKQQMSKAFSNYKLSNGRYSGYGYGWAVSNFKGVTFIHHGGQIGGYLSYGVRIPSQHIYVLILSNSTKVNPDALTTPIALKLLGLSITAVSNVLKLTVPELTSYTGVYEVIKGAADTHKTYREIHLKNDTLFLQRNGYEMPLLCKSRDEFYNPQGTSEVLFHRNNQSKIVAVEIIDLPISFGPTDLEVKTDLPFAPKKEKFSMKQEELKKFTGSYNLTSGVHTVITLESSNLFIEAVGLGKFELLAQSTSSFNIKGVDASIEFIDDNAGVAIGFYLLQSGGKMKASRVN